MRNLHTLTKARHTRTATRQRPVLRVHEVRDEDIIDVTVGEDEELARTERERHHHEAPVEPGVPERIAYEDTLPIDEYGPSRKPRTTPPPPPQPHHHPNA
jgi:hypothetical protein